LKHNKIYAFRLIYFISIIYSMPYYTRKVRGKNCYRVVNKKSKKVFAKCSTLDNAKQQLRLLRALQNNKSFVPYSKLNSKSPKRKTRKNNSNK